MAEAGVEGYARRLARGRCTEQHMRWQGAAIAYQGEDEVAARVLEISAGKR